ncbi:3-hydroxyacyl-ACP dehydratase FabZ [Selenomonas sp. TAMA-11512]|uniref:3-hydroxyacyl-ACP dehydratase FabZ n=1 Tax=Selenomonas sp. TAMA-11512 TaxID=3095337 RepID=UPI0030880206|nr:3-hydroxyacyl-ACP dehydratase FabZ [Selenomonas sp. TAMA-11512]
MTLDIIEIQKILPHRPPMLLVDRIIELVPFESGTGIKNVTMMEPFFRGHFPETPIMPGVLILEAMAQVGGIAMLYPEENRGKLALFGGMENVKFKKPVVPGDQLVMKASLTKVHGDFGKLHADAYVDEQLVAKADFTFALQRAEKMR